MEGLPLLDVEGVLGPESSRSQLPFAFDLGAGAEELEIEFSFSPAGEGDPARARELALAVAPRYGLGAAEIEERAGERLNNLLTLSLDDPRGFRGCGHRHLARQLVTLGRGAATRGFVAGELPAGRWTVTVSAHEVVTTRCEYRLRVRAR